MGRRPSITTLGLITGVGSLLVVYFSKNTVALDVMDFWVGSAMLIVLALFEVSSSAGCLAAKRGSARPTAAATCSSPAFFTSSFATSARVISSSFSAPLPTRTSGVRRGIAGQPGGTADRDLHGPHLRLSLLSRSPRGAALGARGEIQGRLGRRRRARQRAAVRRPLTAAQSVRNIRSGMDHHPGLVLGAFLLALCVLGQPYLDYAALAATSPQTLEITDGASPVSACWIPPKTDARDAIAAPCRRSSRVMARSARRTPSLRQRERNRNRCSGGSILSESHLSSRRILHHAFCRGSTDDQPA